MHSYLPSAIREFEQLRRLGDRAIDKLPGEPFFFTPSEAENSAALIVKHVAGNLHSRWRDFLTSDGEKPDRNRDSEFVLEPGDTRERLLERWESGWAVLFGVLRGLGANDLERTVTIRQQPHTVVEAINRQLTHYGYHVGQLVLLAKHHAGSDWQSLSVPRGESDSFNREMTERFGKQGG